MKIRYVLDLADPEYSQLAGGTDLPGALPILLRDSGLPGMKVLEFGFDPEGESDYMPHNCQSHSVCYIGTHDNETVRGWVQAGHGQAYVRYAREYMHIEPDEGWCWGMIRTGMSTASKLFVVQMQDVLELGAESRVNSPGSVGANWQWRMLPDAVSKDVTKKLREVTHRYRRD
jgi:4-alpha-glucanotransferase